MSVETDGWEVVTKDPWSVTGSPPMLTVYTDGAGRLNAAADRALDEPDAIRFLAKPAENLIGIVPADDEGDALEVYSLTRSEGRGGDVRPQQALETVGVDFDQLGETQTLDFDQDGDVLVADCTSLLDDDSAATHTGDRASDPTTAADDATEDSDDATDVTTQEEAEDGLDDWPDEVWCGVCGAGPFDGKSGLTGHHNGKGHEGDKTPLDYEPEPDEIRHSASEPTLALVRDHVDSVDTVQELGECLEVTAGRARMLARQADVADQLDEDVRPMGVGR